MAEYGTEAETKTVTQCAAKELAISLRYNRKSKTAGRIDDVGVGSPSVFSVSIANSRFDGFPTSLLEIPYSILDIQTETFHCILGILACLP